MYLCHCSNIVPFYDTHTYSGSNVSLGKLYNRCYPLFMGYLSSVFIMIARVLADTIILRLKINPVLFRLSEGRALSPVMPCNARGY